MGIEAAAATDGGFDCDRLPPDAGGAIDVKDVAVDSEAVSIDDDDVG